MADSDCCIPLVFICLSHLMRWSTLLCCSLLNSLKCPITQLDDHYGYISEQHDGAIESGSAVWNSLKSNWYYANDDKYSNKDRNSDLFVTPSHICSAFTLRQTEDINCESWKIKFVTGRRTFRRFVRPVTIIQILCRAYIHRHNLSKVDSSQSTSVPCVIDACLMASNCKIPTSNEGLFADRLYFPSCWCLACCSPSVVTAL